ncbi:MAG: hypothetical protein KME13_19720 [Myxacorys californica WJT36-NPBG1]|jgi:hypothetical protein|nr:hypothetical protein [Myxacorys californica WJT36-NPBG1]
MNYSVQGLVSRLENESSNSDRLRLLAIGSREGVIETIHTLHVLGYAEAGAWSPVLPVPNSTEVMSILTRQRLAQSATPRESR